MSAFPYLIYKTNMPNPLDDVRRVLCNPLDDVRGVLFLATPDSLTLPVCSFSHSQVESSESFADAAGGAGVKIKRRSRLLRELQSSLDGVYWTGSTGPRRSGGSPAARDGFLSRGDFSHESERAYPPGFLSRRNFYQQLERERDHAFVKALYERLDVCQCIEEAVMYANSESQMVYSRGLGRWGRGCLEVEEVSMCQGRRDGRMIDDHGDSR